MSEKEKTAGRLLEEQLTFCFPHIGKEAPGQIEEAVAFCEGYKAFLNEGKTERECVEAAVKRLEAQQSILQNSISRAIRYIL